MAKKNAQEKIAEPPKNVLYVVLHGLVCLIDDKSYNFIADLVDMGDDHEYLCGDFLFEFPIQSGEELTLKGVHEREPTVKNKNDLDTKFNAVVKMPDEPRIDNYYHCRIHLPRPANIHHYIKGKVVADSLKGPLGDLVGTPEKISGIRVFEYYFEDFNEVHVGTKSGETLWKCPEPVLVKDKATRYLNAVVLHIYNEPGQVMANAAKHNRDEFNFTFAHLGTQLRLTTPAMRPEDNGEPPLGIIREELYSLDMREETIRKLTAMMRKLRYPVPGATVELDFAPDRLKQDAELLGGGGGTQVCGGPNGLIGG